MSVSILVCTGMGIDLEEGRFLLRVGRDKEIAKCCYIREEPKIGIHGQEIKSSQELPIIPDRCFHDS
jgi:hypothetical protein